MVEMSPHVSVPIEGPIEDLPRICCEPLAGCYQKVVTCASFAVGAAAITGLVYSILINNEIFTAFCGAITLYCCVVIITNTTCGNISRIHRQFLLACERFEKFRPQLESYQKQITSFQRTLDENRAQIERLTKLDEDEKTTSQGFQTSLTEMETRHQALLQINDELKRAIQEKRQIERDLDQNLESFSGKIADLHKNVQAASDATTEIKKAEVDLEKIVGKVDHGSIHGEIHAMEGRVKESQRLLEENERLRAQLVLIQEELAAERENNGVLTESLKSLRQPGAQKDLNALLRETNAAIGLQIAALQRSKSGGGKTNQ